MRQPFYFFYNNPLSGVCDDHLFFSMFYRIKPVFDEKVTGIDGSQAETAIYPIDIYDPLHIEQWHFKEVPNNVVIPIPKVKNKARLTDLMSVHFHGSSFKLTVSNKLKEILDRYQHGNIQFLPLVMKQKSKDVKNYWLTNILSFDNELAVNYPLSNVLLEGCGYNEYIKVEINSYRQHVLERSKDRNISLDGYRSIYIHKLVFNKMINNNLVIVNYIANGVVGYFVSEKLKRKIEDSGCTGIDFEPVEQS